MKAEDFKAKVMAELDERIAANVGKPPIRRLFESLRGQIDRIKIEPEKSAEPSKKPAAFSRTVRGGDTPLNE